MNLTEKGLSDEDQLLEESLTENEYIQLIKSGRKALEGQTIIERDWSSFVVVGDTHGDVQAAVEPVKKADELDIPIAFLGDYVDRGDSQVETLAYVLGQKIVDPENIVLLRGNHETRNMNNSYGFRRELSDTYSWDAFSQTMRLYEELPSAAVVDEEQFLVHGGIPEDYVELGELKELDDDDPAINEMRWNDPAQKTNRFEFNYLRGAHKLYGPKAVEEFLETNDLSRIIRAHQCFPEGYRYMFDKDLLSIFTVPDYCDNEKGVYAVVDEGEIELKDIES